MTPDTPRGSDGAKLCAWCGGPIKQSGVGRSRDYCSRTHREYAYRARREAEVKLVAYSRGRADAVRPVSSTVDSRRNPVPSVDETRPPGPAPVPAPAAPPSDGWVRSIDVVDAQLRELDARQAVTPPAPAQQKRRHLAARPPTDAPTLFEPDAADGE